MASKKALDMRTVILMTREASEAKGETAARTASPIICETRMGATSLSRSKASLSWPCCWPLLRPPCWEACWLLRACPRPCCCCWRPPRVCWLPLPRGWRLDEPMGDWPNWNWASVAVRAHSQRLLVVGGGDVGCCCVAFCWWVGG